MLSAARRQRPLVPLGARPPFAGPGRWIPFVPSLRYRPLGERKPVSGICPDENRPGPSRRGCTVAGDRSCRLAFQIDARPPSAHRPARPDGRQNPRPRLFFHYADRLKFPKWWPTDLLTAPGGRKSRHTEGWSRSNASRSAAAKRHPALGFTTPGGRKGRQPRAGADLTRLLPCALSDSQRPAVGRADTQVLERI